MLKLKKVEEGVSKLNVPIWNLCRVISGHTTAPDDAFKMSSIVGGGVLRRSC